MTPNTEQQEYIRKKLLDLLKFRETYEELYDHILTALETAPADMTFYAALDNIIKNDLGGTHGIKLADRRYIKLAIKEFAVDYFNTLGQCLKSFVMLLVTLITAVYYQLMGQEWFRGVAGQVIPIWIIIFPSAIIIIKKYIVQKKAGWKVLKIDYAKSSIRPFGNIFMVFFPMQLWLLTSLACSSLQRAGLIARPIGEYGMPINLATIIFFIILIHAVAYYKMYKDWPKIIAASLI